MADNEVSMMMSVYPGAMTGFAALSSGLVSINNVFMQTMSRIDDNFGIIDASIVATGAVVAQFANNAMSAFGEFEQGMKIVQMVSGQTTESINYLSQKANEFSVSYRTDIDQITEGLQTLGRAGLNSASEQAEVLQNGLSTAKLEGRDLNGVLEELIQNTALLGGNLKSSNFGEDSQYVNDLLVGTSMTAPITTHDISETLKYSGGIAAAAGAKIRDDSGNINEEGKAILEDYMGAIALFAQKGVTGSIAGTALRAFFNKPATQDSSVTEALGSIGLTPESLWEDDEETMKPVSTQIGIIQGQMEKLHISTMDRLQIWSKIVGGKMGQQMIKLDSESIKDLTKDIQSAEDATSLAKKSMQTYQANIKEIGEAGAVLERGIGAKLVTIVNPFLEILQKVLGFFNNDFLATTLAAGIVAFLGMVAMRIKTIASQLKAEIGTVLNALRVGADMVTARQLKGDRGVRKPLPGETYTTKVAQDITPSQLLKQFENDFQKTLQKSYIGMTKENVAVVAKSAGWSAESKKIGGLNQTWVSDDGKSFMQARDNAMIAQLARNNLLTPEVQKAFFTGGKKQEIMGTVLSDGRTVRAFIEQTFVKLQSELRKTASVLNETAQASNAVSVEEEKESTIKKETAAQATVSAEEMYNAVKSDFDNMRAAVHQATTQSTSDARAESEVKTQTAAQTVAAAEEVASQVSATNQTVVTNTRVALSEIEMEFLNLARNVAIFNGIPTGANLLPGLRSYLNTGVTESNMFYSKQGTPLTYSQNLAFLFGEQYGNMNEVLRKGYAPYMLGPGQTPWFMAQFNTPRDLFKNGPTQFNAPTDAEAQAARIANYHGTPSHPMSHPNFVDPNVVLKQQEQALEDYKESYIRGKMWGGKGVSASNYGALFRTTGIDYEALDKEAIERKNAVLQQSNIIAEQIKEELLTIANNLTGQRMKDEAILARQKENDKQNQKDMRGLSKAAAINAEKQAEEEAKRNLEKTKRIKNKEYSSQMGTSKPEQVHDSKKSSSFVTQPKHSDNGYMPGVIPTPKQIEDLQNQAFKKGMGYTPSHPIGAMSSLGSEQRAQISELTNTGRTLRESIKSLTYRITGAGSRLGKSGSQPGMWQSFSGTLKDRWNQSRSGRFLNFGTGRIGKGINGVLNLTDAIGGPFMIAMMAFTGIINYVKGLYEQYSQELKKATDAVKEAYDKRKEAEDNIKETYREQNPDATNEEINDMVLQSYTTLYKDLTENHKDYIEKASKAAETPKNYEYDEEKDDGSTKIVEEEIDAETATQEELKKNTAALYSATAELNNALGVLVTKMSDRNWGIDSWSTWLSDALGKYSDSWGGGTTFNSAGGNFLKTASQQDENYSGYGEMAGLMLEDFKDNGDNWIKGMRTMLGDDVDFYSSIMGTHTPADDFMRKSAHFASTEISPQENMRLQASMKNDSKTWKSLGKELAKYENKNKASYNAKKGTDRIQGLIKKLQSTLGAGFDETKILQAAYLQVAQDMFAVAQTVFVPLIQQNAVSAAQTVAGVGQVYNTTGGTGTNTYNTASIASSIAALLGTIALAQSGDAGRTQAMLGGDVDGDGTPDTAADKKLQQLALDTNSGDEFMREAIKQSQGNTTVDWIGNMITKAGMPQAGAPISALSPYLGSDRTAGDYLARIYGMTTYMTVYGMDSQSAMERIDGFIEDAKKRGVSPLAELQTLGKNWTYPGFVQKVEDAYLNSPDEEDSGSGSGGSGSGDGDKDKNQGTKKERVDLVLCNKKEIPKLNVNLFKKPPTFTVLNKNFKLRDVKINTEDKPKAIMASIKNAFIDVQKRSDPKIIQDEEAEYDPVAATDGNSVPSGSSRTGTNQ